MKAKTSYKTCPSFIVFIETMMILIVQDCDRFCLLFGFVFTDLLEDLVGQEGPPLVSPGLALLQRLWGHQRWVGSLSFLCKQLDDHRLHIKEQHMHIRVRQVGLHGLDHQGIMGVFRQVAL